MVEIFRDQSPVLVGHYKTIVEQAGILCMVKNESIAMTEIPIPTFFPALYVMKDQDAERAIELLRKYRESEEAEIEGEDVICSQCDELNPANFDVCWSCGGEINE